MTQLRVASSALLILLGLAGSAPAQMPAQGVPPCMTEFMPIRTEAETRAKSLKEGIDKKVARQDLCGLFKRFTESESKVIKFYEANQTSCGIPAQTITEAKAGHAKTVQVRQKVCSTDPVQGDAKPKGPGLGEALGTRIIPTPDNTTTGRGTFDTLTGNALTR